MCPTKQDKINLGYYWFLTKMPLGQAICLFISSLF